MLRALGQVWHWSGVERCHSNSVQDCLKIHSQLHLKFLAHTHCLLPLRSAHMLCLHHTAAANDVKGPSLTATLGLGVE